MIVLLLLLLLLLFLITRRVKRMCCRYWVSLGDSGDVIGVVQMKVVK